MGNRELFHANSLEVLDGRHVDRHPAFRKGNLLISCRNTSTLAVLDMDAGKIVWALTGAWKRQHDPSLLDNGNILVFDNVGCPNAEVLGKSRVLEIDPGDGDIRWSYVGAPGNPLFTHLCGAVQRIPDGTTLITESQNGRALLVDANGASLWEFYSPHRAGPQEQMVATLFEMTRLSPDFPLDWLHR